MPRNAANNVGHYLPGTCIKNPRSYPNGWYTAVKRIRGLVNGG